MAVLLLLLTQGQPAYAATITVNATGDAIADDGGCTLREAITAANTDTASGVTAGECAAGSGADTLVVPTGTYTLSIAGPFDNFNATGDLDIASDLTITGAGAATTIIDGNALDRVFQISGGTVEISGLTIENGSPSDPQGGGGILKNGGTLALTNSTVRGNSAGDFPGGGGIENSGGTLTLANSTVSGNSAISYGGGIWNDVDTTTLTNSTVSGNTNNGIRNEDGTLSVTNSTVSGNTGGGIYNHPTGTATLKNTIVADNCAGSIVSAGHNLDRGNTCGFMGTGDLINTDSMLGPLAANGGPTQTHALLAGSPAIDAGSDPCTDIAGSPVTTDQRGVARPQDGNGDGTAVCDIGAYEFEAASTPGKVTGDGQIPGSAGGKASFDFVVQFSSGDPSPTGHLTYIDRKANVRIKATSYDLLLITGTHAKFTGTATLNGVPGKPFEVEVDDLSEPGSADTLRIEILEPGGYTASGVLIGGNIQIHK